MIRELLQLNILPTIRRNSLMSLIIRKNSQDMRDRAPNKYNAMLAILKVFPDLQIAYHFGRKLDDIADGDSLLPENYDYFPNLTKHLKNALLDRSLIYEAGECEFLMREVLVRTKSREKIEGETKAEIDKFLDAILFDYLRRERHLTLGKNELETVYLETFGHALNIAFIILGSNCRFKDIPELGLAQGKAFAVKDLREDVEMGICNIPKGVLDLSGLSFYELMTNPNLAFGNPVLAEWMTTEMAEARNLVSQLKKKKLDFKARILINFLSLGVTRKWKSEQGNGLPVL